MYLKYMISEEGEIIMTWCPDYPLSRNDWNWYIIPEPPSGLSVEAVTWCRKHESPGQYYFSLSAWYFEYEKDALMFALKWGA